MAVDCVDGRTDVSDIICENNLQRNELFKSDTTCSYAGSLDECILKFNFGNNMVNESKTRVCIPDTNSQIHHELLADQSGDNTLSDDTDSASVQDVLVVKENSKLIHVTGTIMAPIQIKGKSINAVLDTAAQVSVLNDMFVTQNWPDVQFSGGVSLQGIGNNSVQSHLWENVSITLGNMDYPWHVFVAPIHDTCILGLDFIMQYEFDIRMSSDGHLLKVKKLHSKFREKINRFLWI